MLKITGNERLIEKIGKMSQEELLQYVLDFPEYLVDGYYNEFKGAIHGRAKELATGNSKPPVRKRSKSVRRD